MAFPSKGKEKERLDRTIIPFRFLAVGCIFFLFERSTNGRENVLPVVPRTLFAVESPSTRVSHSTEDPRQIPLREVQAVGAFREKVSLRPVETI